jgi:Membrane proteins related to metalloendopeptidases
LHGRHRALHIFPRSGMRTERFITTAELILPAQALWELPLLPLPTVLLSQATAVVHTTGARATAVAAAAVTVTM